MSELKLKQISYSYGKARALDNVDIEAGNGCFGLLGPNGAGKSTLINIIAGIFPPDEGRMSFDGLDNAHWGDIKHIMGFVPQSFGMYKYLKVREVLKHFAILKGLDINKINSECDRVIGAVSLRDKADSRIGALSGGMVRRLCIAQALLGRPKLLLLDEPTAGLDPQERMAFRNTILEMSRDSVVILSTHIVEDVEACCDHVTVLDHGHVLACGETDEIRRLSKGKIGVMPYNAYSTGVAGKLLSTYTDGNSQTACVVLREGQKDIPRKEPTLEDSYLYLLSWEENENG